MKKHNLENIDLFDFHCHIDLHNDYPNCLLELSKNNMAIIAVTTTPLAWQMNLKQSLKYNFIIPALGIHPQLVIERENDFKSFKNYIDQALIIGEVGLDNNYPNSKVFNKQLIIFESVLKLCETGKKKLFSIHSYKASREVIALLFKYNKNIIPILHWFTGSINEALLAVNIGCYFSVNLSMLRTIKGSSLIKNLPKERILTETDFPFTKESNSMLLHENIKMCINEISKIWEVDYNVTQNILKTNSLKILDI